MSICKVVLALPGAVAPSYESAGAAAADVRGVRWKNSLSDADWNYGRAIINGGKAVIFDTGLQFEVPEGYELKAHSRSGHGFKSGVRLSNCTGILDSDYRGNLMLRLHNDSDTAFIIEAGERIGQVQIKEAPQHSFEVVSELSDTVRGEGGFGSTGVK